MHKIFQHHTHHQNGSPYPSIHPSCKSILKKKKQFPNQSTSGNKTNSAKVNVDYHIVICTKVSELYYQNND